MLKNPINEEPHNGTLAKAAAFKIIFDCTPHAEPNCFFALRPLRALDK
jgi:hypothetical protein